MDKRAALLATLGLAPDASWDEVTQAYKDLMRVWHPDRFQGDERLCKKAEAQAQRINEAMSELRKMGKEPTRPASHSTHHNTAQTTRTTHETTQSRATRDTAQQETAHSSNQRAHTTSSFAIAPLHVHQRFGASFFRIVVASVIFYIAYDSLANATLSTSQEAASLAFAFLALDFGVRNLTVMLLPKPLVAIERNGLFFLKTGRLSWADIESAWPVMSSRYHQLSLVLSPHYLNKRNIILRTLLRMRRWAKTPHLVIPFNGLTADPVAVINAMRLRQIHHDIALEDPPQRRSGWILAALTVGIICASVAFARCALGLTAAPSEYIPYFIIFGLCRASVTALRVWDC